MGRGVFAHQFSRLKLALRQPIGLGVIGLGQHDLEAHGSLVQQAHGCLIAGLGLDPGIEQQQHPPQGGAAAQEVKHQPLPVFLHRFRRLGVAIARHINQAEPPAKIEEVQLLGAARRV